MLCGIKGKLVNAELVERGASRNGQSLPMLVRHDGAQLWVEDNEGDGRLIPTDIGPRRPESYQAEYQWTKQHSTPE